MTRKNEEPDTGEAARSNEITDTNGRSSSDFNFRSWGRGWGFVIAKSKEILRSHGDDVTPSEVD